MSDAQDANKLVLNGFGALSQCATLASLWMDEAVIETVGTFWTLAHLQHAFTLLL